MRTPGLSREHHRVSLEIFTAAATASVMRDRTDNQDAQAVERCAAALRLAGLEIEPGKPARILR